MRGYIPERADPKKLKFALADFIEKVYVKIKYIIIINIMFGQKPKIAIFSMDNSKGVRALTLDNVKVSKGDTHRKKFLSG